MLVMGDEVTTGRGRTVGQIYMYIHLERVNPKAPKIVPTLVLQGYFWGCEADEINQTPDLISPEKKKKRISCEGSVPTLVLQGRFLLISAQSPNSQRISCKGYAPTLVFQGYFWGCEAEDINQTPDLISPGRKKEIL